MDWLFLLMLGLGANLDNLGVGVAYGIRRIHVDWKANAIIAGIALAATAGAGLIGHALGTAMNVHTANRIGAGILLLVGLWVGVTTWLDRAVPSPAPGNQPQRLLRIPLGLPGFWLEILRDPQKADVDRTGTIDPGEAVLLGIALCLNNLGIGLGGGLAGHATLPMAALTAAGSWITISVGDWLGRVAGSRWLGRGASYAACALLLVLAILEWR